MKRLQPYIEKYYVWYLIGLTILVLFMSNFMASSFTTLADHESYYSLYNADQGNALRLGFLPIKIFAISTHAIGFLPLLLGIACIILCLLLQQKVEMKKIEVFVFLSFLILTPAFINLFTTLSVIGLFAFYSLLGVFFLLNQKRIFQYFSLVPFTFAVTFDVMLSLLLVLIILSLYFSKRVKVVDNTIIASIVFVIAVVSAFLLSLPIVSGPFYEKGYLANIVSDLGAISGVSFFLLLLAFIGILFVWRKRFSFIAYILLAYCIGFYFYSTQAIAALALIVCYFATAAFMKLYDRVWRIPLLKNITLFLFILGVLFSAISYIDRIDTNIVEPSVIASLEWINEHAKTNAVVLALPEQEYLVREIAKRDAIASFRSNESVYKRMLNNSYIDQTTRLFEQYNVTYILVTPQMREQVGENKGILFLLVNERFKLRFEHDETQVWMFS